MESSRLDKVRRKGSRREGALSQQATEPDAVGIAVAEDQHICRLARLLGRKAAKDFFQKLRADNDNLRTSKIERAA